MAARGRLEVPFPTDQVQDHEMSEVVNFNKARKARLKAEAAAAAKENRAKFGRTRAERNVAKDAADRLNRTLDSARRDPPAKED